MRQSHRPWQKNPNSIPDFSIVIETENLSRAPSEDLTRCLESLAKRDISPAHAREVILVESGDAPDAFLQQLRHQYSWLTVHRMDQAVGYYEAKMEGVRRVTGDVVVFCDSDCWYPRHWLGEMLRGFSSRPEIQALAGETRLRMTGPFSLAIALTWGFPTLSKRKEIYKKARYATNNVAYKRSFLMKHPIPDVPSLYRVKCTLHAFELRNKGYPIWRNDQAWNIHSLPAKTFKEFIWRYMVAGYDSWMWDRLSRRESSDRRPRIGYLRDLISFIGFTVHWLWRPLIKIPRSVSEDPHRILYLPLALPIAALGILFYMMGFILTLFLPRFLFEHGIRKLERNPWADGQIHASG